MHSARHRFRRRLAGRLSQPAKSAETGGLHAKPEKARQINKFWLLDLGSNQGPTD
jgi:hypothetical protein